MLRATDDHRRARIARRHGLHPDHRFDSIEAATVGMTALHATEVSTPYISLHARMDHLIVDDVDRALYDDRSIVRTMAMRRTLWIVPRDLLPAVSGSAGRRVADEQRRLLVKETADLEFESGADWIADAARRVIDTLTGQELSARQLRDALPDLGGTFTAAPGTKWSTEVPVMRRLLTMLTASGDIVRGHNDGPWRTPRPLWTSMAGWLGEELEPTTPEAGYAAIVGRLLWTFGPASEDDIVWWLGSTKGAVRSALAAVEALGVELDDGTTGWVLPDDTADLEVAPAVGAMGGAPPDARPDDDGLARARARVPPRPGARPVPVRPRRQRRDDRVGRRADRRVLGAGRRRTGRAHPHGGHLGRRPTGARRRDHPARRVPARRPHHQRVRLAADEAPASQLNPSGMGGELNTPPG